MIRIENVDVFGWEAAVRGMRNPMNSWDKSDSACNECNTNCVGWEKCGAGYPCPISKGDNFFMLGKTDLKLMYSLSKAGNDHAKFLRMINVTCDIAAPRYWWIEFDTYKVGTVCNSCSTMHRITEKEFTLDDFSTEHLYPALAKSHLQTTIHYLNAAREEYLKNHNKDDWWQIIQLLPQSYNQRRTVQLNYQVLKSMYHSRKNHKLDEWRAFCGWCESLPYFKEICVDMEG